MRTWSGQWKRKQNLNSSLASLPFSPWSGRSRDGQSVGLSDPRGARTREPASRFQSIPDFHSLAQLQSPRCPGSHPQGSVCPFFPFRSFLLQARVLETFGRPQLHQRHRLFRVLGTGQSIALSDSCHNGPRPYNTGGTRRPEPQRADSQDKCPRFPGLALSPAHT